MNPTPETSTSSSDVILSLQGIEKSFGDKKVHRGVNLEVKRGEILALFGGSGTGKSVILRSIIGLESPDAGAILFEGQDLTQISESAWIQVRKKIAYVFQNGALFDSLSVEENLAYPLREHTRLGNAEILSRVEAALEQVDMKGSNLLLPNELSGGMQKRAGLARATMLGQEVILFDEPTAGLDPKNTQRLIHNMARLKTRGISGVFVTHDIPAAFEIADRIAILHQGKIHICASVQEIQASSDPIVLAFTQSGDEL